MFRALRAIPSAQNIQMVQNSLLRGQGYPQEFICGGSLHLIASWVFSLPKTKELSPNKKKIISQGMHKVLNNYKGSIERNVYI